VARGTPYGGGPCAMARLAPWLIRPCEKGGMTPDMQLTFTYFAGTTTCMLFPALTHTCQNYDKFNHPRTESTNKQNEKKVNEQATEQRKLQNYVQQQFQI